MICLLTSKHKSAEYNDIHIQNQASANGFIENKAANLHYGVVRFGNRWHHRQQRVLESPMTQTNCFFNFPQRKRLNNKPLQLST